MDEEEILKKVFQSFCSTEKAIAQFREIGSQLLGSAASFETELMPILTESIEKFRPDSEYETVKLRQTLNKLKLAAMMYDMANRELCEFLNPLYLSGMANRKDRRDNNGDETESG